ncbi:3-hydroxyacyl-CoA dehydrogenase NAD-binding domain-containing protein [Jatrophihabitans sp.]|uniref:3-hydroxyacyl-CoA dehydrogenase NAD-binding domain-containing protein n=1 Tax=Jatrophihabitans sp. TaxID=1932789 RepID=UPI0030C77178|nr:putative fatty acid oxidation complex protein [Jatrophihabitans sp.]
MTSVADKITVVLDADGVATLTFDDPEQSTNTLNVALQHELRAKVSELGALDGLTGVIVTSGKPTFFAGGDLHDMLAVHPDSADELFGAALAFKATLRALETLPVPVVAALNGAALGGGLEIAFATHHRIALRGARVEFGLPEVTLGLLPGAGGVVRSVRLLGLQPALDILLLEGRRYSADDARSKGIVDEVVDTPEELIAQAKVWIAAHPDAKQPWDRPGFSIPVPAGWSDELYLPALVAGLRKKTKGAPALSQHHVLCAAVEGKDKSLDVASVIETRYFIDLVTGQQAKSLIRARFLDPLAARRGSSRPAGQPTWKPTKLAILGAGMMGAGIAYQAAIVGLDVVLKDTSIEAAERGKAYSVKLLEKAVAAGSRTPEERDAILKRIHATADTADCSGADLVIEAVFESESLKHEVLREIDAVVSPDAVIGSNTSTIPITDLAVAVSDQTRVVGMHFFSPVDRMPLLEIIRAKHTSDQTLARAFDAALLLKKTPIVVNDNRGFFTSRVIGTVVNEGVAMLGEGLNPSSIERAATTAGYPVGMLQLTDELNMELSVKVFGEARQAREAAGEPYVPHPAELVIQKMYDLGRPGRLRGAGFYDYGPDGRRTGLWSQVRTTFNDAEHEIPFLDMQERLLFIEAVESVRCLQEGVLTSPLDGNVGSVMGIGYPAWTGGVFGYINQYEGGAAGFTRRADELAKLYGERFEPPARLREVALAGGRFE